MKLQFFTETEDNGALAREIAEIPDVLAVIGHELDGPTIPASITYESNGMLFIAPKSTDIRLTACISRPIAMLRGHRFSAGP